MKRSGFKRPQLPPRAPMVLRPAERTGVIERIADVVVAVPKSEKARPGKRAQTVEEERWISRILAFGCVACWLDGSPVGYRDAEVHHILRGGVRMGHLYSLPLCQPGHHRNGQHVGMISRHPWKARFEERYGSEQHLLNLLQGRLGFPLLQIEASR